MNRLSFAPGLALATIVCAPPAAAQPGDVAPGTGEVEPLDPAGETLDDDAKTVVPAEEPVDVSVFGKARTTKRVAGSAHKVDEEELERREDDNAHRILARVPGVYVRGEDGYGLRPNIGLRGGNSDRSSKVTLMEDGVLLGPAPYSAPAAYYFPLMTRMVGGRSL
ncbi:MAG: TonB-dependent receptor plug domain-containing protein [Myxococcota bacterium]